MEDCIFCKIVKKEIPSETVYEDDSVYAFLDIGPVNPGHTLVIPKSHFVNIFDAPNEIISDMVIKAKKIAKAIKKAGLAEGLFLAMNNEKEAGQVVFHAHIHLIPRLANDGYKHWPHKKYEEGESKEIAEKIKKEI